MGRRGPGPSLDGEGAGLRGVVRSSVEAVAHEQGAVEQFVQARTHFGRSLYQVSAYLVDGLLIDVGPRHCRDRLLRVLGGRRVEVAAVTHAHEDHVGNVGPLQRGTAFQAFASEATLAAASSGGRMPLYRRHVWGRPDGGELTPTPRTISTRRYRFDVLDTPGHTPGDLTLVEAAQGWAFTGDLVLSPRQTITMRQEDLAATVASLERVLAYRPRLLFTGIRVFEDGTRVLEERLAFIRGLVSQARSLQRDGRSATGIRRALLGREPWLHYWSGGEFGRGHFARQLLASGRALA